MSKLTPEDIDSLYPTAKPPEQIRAEQQLRMLARRPKKVYAKTSWCVSLVLVLLLLSNQLIMASIGGASAFGSALSGTSLAMLLGLVTFGIIWYLYNYVCNLLYRIDINVSAVKAASILILILSFALYLAVISYQPSLWLAILIPFSFSFLTSYVCLRFVVAKI